MKRLFLLIAFLLYVVPAFADPSCLQLPIDGNGQDIKNIPDDYANDDKHGAFRPAIPQQLIDLYGKLAYTFTTIGFPRIIGGKPQFTTLFACFLDSLVIPPGLGPMTRDEAAMFAHNRDPSVPFKPDALKIKPPKTTAELFFNRVWRTAWRYFGPALAWATTSPDNFNRGSGTDLGSAWDAYNDGAPTDCSLDTDRAAATNDLARCVEGYSTYIPGANQYVQFTLVEASWGGAVDVSAYLRLAPPTTLTGYACRIQPSDGTNRTRIRRYDGGGSNSALANDTSTVWVNGDLVRCEVSGTTITAYQNGVSVLTWPGDATYATGRAGIGILSTPTSFGNVNWIDDFETGDLAAGATIRRHRAVVLQ